MTRRPPGPGAARWAAHRPASSSKASASRRCNVRRKVDSEGTAPVTPSPARVCRSASAAHSAIAVNERAPASTAHTARPKTTTSRCRTPRRCRGSATLASTASKPGGPSRPPPAKSARWPMAGSIGEDDRAGIGSPGSAQAGVVTAMITPRAVPALLHPGHLPAATPPVIIRKDFADPLGHMRRTSAEKKRLDVSFFGSVPPSL
jgi:hypothetical protein